MDNDGDAVQCDDRLGQTVGLLLVLQAAGGQTDVRRAVLHGLDAGAGAGGIIGDGDVLVVRHELLPQSADDLVHGGGTVGGHGTAELGGLIIVRGVVVVGAAAVFAAAAGQKGHDHNGGQQDTDDLFHMKISFRFSCLDLLSCYSPHDKGAV